jgi:AcrR family transcriptional regulator
MADKPLTRRQEQALETKNRIYNAAVELMERKGFDNVTVADISKAAGVSIGAFYHYFESKNDILAEIFHRADEYFSTQVAPSLGEKPAPEQILEFFDHYARFNIASGVAMVRQLFNPMVRFFAWEDRPMLAILRELIRRGQERGEIRTDMSPEEMVRFLFVVARGLVFDWGLREGSYNLESMMRHYMERVIATLKP